MNLQHLRYFSLACKYHNISRAAEECHMSQSSISSAIKALEEEFNTTLIQRQRTGFILTNAGEKFLSLCDGLLTQADAVSGIMSEFNQSHRTIRLGVPPMTGAVILSDLLEYFQEEHPDIKISISEAGGIELLKKLSDNLLDFVFIPDTQAIDTLKYNSKIFRIYEDVCCISKDNPLSKKDDLCIEDLKDLPIIIFSNSFYHHNNIQKLFESYSFTPSIIHQTTQLSTLEQLIAKNVGFGFLFKERAKQLDTIQWFHLSPKVTTSISLVWKKELYLTKDMHALFAYCERENTNV